MLANLLLAAEKEAPLIDLDGTIFLQFGIFLILALVLYLLVFKPYLALRDEREARTSGARQRAKSVEGQASLVESDLQARLAVARRRAEAERLRLRQEGAAGEREVLAAARLETERAIEEGRRRLADERQRVRGQLMAEVEPLAREITGRILGRRP